MFRKRIINSILALRLIISFSLLFFLLIFLNSCTSLKTNWERAIKINTIESYESFLNRYPKSEFASEAKKRIEGFKKRIEKFEWNEANKINTIEVYLNFLEKNPCSEYIIQIIKFLEDRVYKFHELDRGYIIKFNYAIREFKKIMEKDRTPTNMKCIVMADPGKPGMLLISSENAQIFINLWGESNLMVWNPGAEHKLLGYLMIGGYKFLSNPYNPLVFKMVEDEGYVFQKGEGFVITPFNEIVYLKKVDRP